jgi:hypothetical protein
MTAIVRNDDEAVGTEEFLRLLKLTGQFEGLIEELVRGRLMDEDGLLETTDTWRKGAR